MKSIAVIGGSEFTLGFRLTGIRNVTSTESPQAHVKDLMADAEVGVIIIDESTMEKLSPQLREDVVASISPVFVTVSEHASQEELRKMIVQSIGVDLLKNE